jgi:hypothetical protein
MVSQICLAINIIWLKLMLNLRDVEINKKALKCHIKEIRHTILIQIKTQL